MNGVFVAGTDTGVGKTRVAVGLVRSLRMAGVRVAGMKPVAAGIDPGAAMNEDVVALAAADGLGLPPRVRNPYAFADPIAPHLAARDAGIAMDLRTVAEAARAIRSRAGTLVVEGAGGVRVPFAPGLDMLDVAKGLDLPVLLVVGVRLGCLNHALLAADAVAARGLRLAGWVANRIDPSMLRADDNVVELDRLLPAPRLADVPWGATPAFDRPALSRLPLGLDPKAC